MSAKNNKSKGTEIAPLPKDKTKKVTLTAEFGEVYIKVTPSGQIIKPVRAMMSLYEKMGHYYKVGDKWAITKAGYFHLNKVASINLVTPQKVVVDGVEQPNPYIERNPQTKLTESVFIRKMGIGYGPMGNIVVMDKTLSYNIFAYFIESIQAKMKQVFWENDQPTSKRKFPDCGHIGVLEDKPEKGKWAFLATAAPLGIWVNYDDPIIIACMNEHTQRQRFGDRIAQAIVERNILKSHPAIAAEQIIPQATGGRAFVEVYCYRHDLGPYQIKELMAQAEKGSEDLEIEAEKIEEIPDEEEAKAVQEIIEDESKGAESAEKTPAEMDEPNDEFFEKQKKKKAESKPEAKE